jgi:hypothetical protein
MITGLDGAFGALSGVYLKSELDRLRQRAMKLFLTTAALIVCTSLAASSAGVAQDITSSISKAEPVTKQDDTAAHPYAAASQCATSTDLIFWPNGQSTPNFPPDISVCFVGDQLPSDSSSVRIEIHD